MNLRRLQSNVGAHPLFEKGRTELNPVLPRLRDSTSREHFLPKPSLGKEHSHFQGKPLLLPGTFLASLLLPKHKQPQFKLWEKDLCSQSKNESKHLEALTNDAVAPSRWTEFFKLSSPR